MRWPNNCIRSQELLSSHTSFRIGGPAEYFAEPTTLDELVGLVREAKNQAMPISVVGGGTNTLAPDRGIRGLVVHLGRGFQQRPDANRTEHHHAYLSPQQLAPDKPKYRWSAYRRFHDDDGDDYNRLNDAWVDEQEQPVATACSTSPCR